MTVCLVGTVNLHRYTQIEWKKSTNSFKKVLARADKEREKTKKETKAAESQFAVLESEKTALIKALKEAKAAKDEALAMADSLKSE